MHGALDAASGDSGDAASELGFTGALRLSGGLVLMGARVYSPALRVFMQPDPLYPFKYTYVSGDPVNLVDPTGMIEKPSTKKMYDPPWANWAGDRGWSSGYGETIYVNANITLTSASGDYGISRVNGRIVIWYPANVNLTDDQVMDMVNALNNGRGAINFTSSSATAGVEDIAVTAVRLRPVSGVFGGQQLWASSDGPNSGGHSWTAVSAEAAAHGGYHAAKSPALRFAACMTAKEIAKSVTLGGGLTMEEGGVILARSVWTGVGSAVVEGFAVGAVQGVGMALEVVAYDMAVAAVTNDIYVVLSRGRY